MLFRSVKLNVGFFEDSCRVKLDKNLGDWMSDFLKILNVGFLEINDGNFVKIHAE